MGKLFECPAAVNNVSRKIHLMRQYFIILPRCPDSGQSFCAEVRSAVFFLVKLEPVKVSDFFMLVSHLVGMRYVSLIILVILIRWHAFCKSLKERTPKTLIRVSGYG